MSNDEDVEYTALEYHSNGSFHPAEYAFHGSTDAGWRVERSGQPHLSLGSGYRLLRTECCGVCSTDLDRHFLPFPLPQITGHELVARDAEGRRFVVEINASHAARGLRGDEGEQSDCPFCNAGLATHCPDRIVLGIHDLPGGFGPYVLVPREAAIELPEELPTESAVLIEPFAAALNAVEMVSPGNGERVAVLGPRRLGMLIVAALAAHRRAHGLDYQILALARHDSLRQLALRVGADEAPEFENAAAPIADVVFDTTANPEGLELAIRLAEREVHLKSTHGQPAVGLAHLTELVVDEISLARFPADEGAARDRLAGLDRSDGARPPRVAWLAGMTPPDWLANHARVHRGADAAALLREIEGTSVADEIPRTDAAVVERREQIDAALRPDSTREISLVRPRGEIQLLSGAADPDDGPLVGAIRSRGLRLSGSRCGDFHEALELMRNDEMLRGLGELLVTHHFPADQLADAFDKARSREAIKVVVDHPGARARRSARSATASGSGGAGA
jgi:threonine dehydrogenase-like Zn-dependent dehydrogenase